MNTAKSGSPRLICINGDLGSGKSTISRILALRLGYKVYSTGQAQRAIAERLGISTLELNRRAETDPATDALIDAVFAGLGTEPHGLVVDSRMAWHFLKNAAKVRLACHPETCAKRISGDSKRQAEGYLDVNAAIVEIRARRFSELKRFNQYYGVDVEDLSNYNLVVQTDATGQEHVADLILSRLSSLPEAVPEIVLSPHLIFPLDDVRNLGGASKDLAIASTDGLRLEVLYYKDCFFVVDGHHRLSRALRFNEPWIEANLLPEGRIPGGMTANAFLENEFVMSRVYDWESVHGFEFPFYPSFEGLESHVHGTV